MKQEKFKPDKKRRANVLKQERHFRTFFSPEVKATAKNTVSKQGEIKMWILFIGAIVFFVGLFALSINLIK